MSRATKINVPPYGDAPPQCSGALVVDPRSLYRKSRALAAGLDPMICVSQSKWIVDGKPYCTLHGGLKALEILSGET